MSTSYPLSTESFELLEWVSELNFSFYFILPFNHSLLSGIENIIYYHILDLYLYLLFIIMINTCSVGKLNIFMIYCLYITWITKCTCMCYTQGHVCIDSEWMDVVESLVIQFQYWRTLWPRSSFADTAQWLRSLSTMWSLWVQVQFKLSSIQTVHRKCCQPQEGLLPKPSKFPATVELATMV